MSVEAMVLVLHHSLAADADLAVLMGVANHEGDGGAWPSIATLAKYARKSERTVQRCIRNLVALGELAVYEQEGGTTKTHGGYRPNRYEVLLSCPAGCDGTKNHRMRGDVSDTPTPRSRGDMGDTPADVRGDMGDASGVTPLSPEPSLNRPTKDDRRLPVVTMSPPATMGGVQSQIDAVFQAWVESTGRTGQTRLDAKRTAAIVKRLREGWPVEDLCDAVRGWRHFAHNRGENDRLRPFNSVELCLSDAEHIERFRDAERGTAATPELTGMARIRAMTNAPPAAPQRFGQVIDVAAS